MKKIGLIAGGGSLPLEFIKQAAAREEKVVVFALQGMASEKAVRDAHKVYWVKIGQYAKFAFLLARERIRHLALLGKVDKKVLFSEKYDTEAENVLKKLKNREDYSILEEITRHLKKIGVEVINGKEYLEHLVPEKGVLSAVQPDEKIRLDIEFGYAIAKQIAGMDIGQTLIVKDKTVVAVEAMEGTDEVIKRAFGLAGRGCVMVKVSRPKQDSRWDVPTVGADTMRLLAENGFSALAVESTKMFLINRQETIDIANINKIVLQVL